MRTTKRKMATLTRFDFRIEPARKQAIERAASLLGMTLSQFAKWTLEERAEEIFQKYSTTVLSTHDLDIFLAALEADAKPGVATVRAVKRFKERRDATGESRDETTHAGTGP